MRRVQNPNIAPMLPTGGGYEGYTGYGAPEDEMAAAMMAKEAAAVGVGPEVVGGAPNYDALDRNAGFYQDMLSRGMDSSPTNFTGGLARLANAFVGRQGLNRVERSEREAQEYEIAQAQAQKDKFSEMAAAMVPGGASPQTLAMAQMFPEQYMEAQMKANEPYTLGKDEVRHGAGGAVLATGPAGAPDFQTATIKDPNNPNRLVEVQYDPQDPQGTMTIIGEAQPRSALVENKVNLGDGGINELTPFEKKQDELYADMLAQWNTGGAADSLKNLGNLTSVANRLEAGEENLTGWIIGNTPDLVLGIVNPEAFDAKDLVEEVVQRNLRVVLGAQFTEKEGARLIARAYNARLPEEVNASRLRSLIQMVESRAQQLQSLNEYVQENRTAAGWNGRLRSVDEMLIALDEESDGANTPQRGQRRKRWNPVTQSVED